MEDKEEFEKKKNEVNFPLIGFVRRTTYLLGAIQLPFVLGEGWKAIRVEIIFIFSDALRSWANDFELP